MKINESKYRNLLKNPQWFAKREAILVRDNYACRNCKNSTALHVHHRQYHFDKDGMMVMPWAYEDKYLVTLCDECHRRGHELYKVPSYKICK